MSLRKKGHIPDPPGHMVTSAKYLLGSSSKYPKTYSMRDFCLVGDQLTTSTCVGWTLAQAIYVSFKNVGLLLPDFPSPQGIYTVARCIDRISLDEPLFDFGSMPNQAMRGMTEWGVPIITDWPFHPENINDEPDLESLKRASRLKLLGYYRIDNNETFIDMYKRSINSGYPVAMASDVGYSFENYNGNGVISAQTEDLGSHYVLGIGYDTMANGSTVVEIVNSWGTSWGDHGFCLVDESFMLNTRDRYVMNLHRMG